MISGTFTNWKLHKMYPLTKFCSIIDPNYSCSSFTADPALSTRENAKLQATHEKQMKAQELKYRKLWSSIFNMNLKYSPFYCNYPEDYSYTEDTFVYVAYLKPRRHSYVVKDQKEWQYVEVVTKPRQEPLVVTNKEVTRNVVKREFKKEASVFAQWKEDNSKEINIHKDISKWKVQRFCKDNEDYEEVVHTMQEHVMYLKTAYICIISNSNFPAITWNDFTSFVSNCKLLDENLSLATVDRLFIATKSSGTQDLEDYPERDLSRLEFYEILVRMAGAKYKDSGKTSNFNEAVRRFIENDLIPSYSIDKWMNWRKTELWTLDVNDILFANIEALKKIYKSFFNSKKQYMDLSDAITLLLRRTGLFAAEKDIIHCFGMCQSTIVNEIAKRKEYNNINFAEFLEFLCRAAEIYFKSPLSNSQAQIKILSEIDEEENKSSDNEGNESDLVHQETLKSERITLGITLTKKIEILLDALLPMYGLKRKEVKIEIEFDSDSSDS